MNPFGITQVDIPGLLGMHQQLKRQRLQDLYMAKRVEQEDRKFDREERTAATRLKAGELAKDGDFKGAQAEAIGAGDSELFEAITKMDSAQRAALQENNAKFGNALKWADTPQKWDTAVDYLAANGHPEIAQYKGQFGKRDEVALNLGQIDKLITEVEKGVVMAPGSQLRDPRTGALIGQAPFAPQVRTVGPDQSLVEFQPGGGGQSSTGASGQQIEQLALAAVPGATITSRQRSDEHNREVGGKPNSYHLTDQARDLVPPQGVHMAEFHAKLQQQFGPGFDVINEGDHVHIEPSSRGGGPRVLATGASKAGFRTLTPQEAAAKNLDPSVVWQEGPDGKIQVVQGQPKASKTDQPYSQSAIDAFDRAIDSAARLKKHPGLSTAVGVKGLSGGLLGGWVVPGTDAADFNAELDAMKAQVFLPMVQSMKGMGALSNAEGEKLTAAIGALNPKMSEAGFTASIDRIVTDLKQYRDRGAPKKAAPAVGTVKNGYRFNGGNPGDPKNWSKA